MPDAELPCVWSEPSARTVHSVRPAGLESFLAALPPAHAQFLRGCDFAGRPGELVLLQDAEGIAGAAFGLGEDRAPFPFGDLPFRLPDSVAWQLAPGDYDADLAVLGWCLGGYRFARFKAPKRAPARLVLRAPARLARARRTTRRDIRRRRSGWRATSSTRPPTCSARPNSPTPRWRWRRRSAPRPMRVEGDALDDGLSDRGRGRRAARRARPVVAALPLARQRRRRRRHRCSRCAARACASIPAATTSSPPPACCA